MFTGIIEEIGIVENMIHNSVSSSIKIKANKILTDIHLGDSIAVNGVCLTVTNFTDHTFSADVMNETFNRSSLGSLSKNAVVNLERAMPVNGRFGGHIVSGHIDGIGKIEKISQDGIATWFTISTSKDILHLIVEKGSIAIDGISLTVAKVTEQNFSVSIIPHTSSQTTLSFKKENDIVNLENDMVSKYICKFIHNNNHTPTTQSPISLQFLQENGF